MGRGLIIRHRHCKSVSVFIIEDLGEEKPLTHSKGNKDKDYLLALFLNISLKAGNSSLLAMLSG